MIGRPNQRGKDRFLLALLPLMAVAGCHLVPQLGPPPMVGPVFDPTPESVAVVLDSTFLAGFYPDSSKTSTERPAPDRPPAQRIKKPARKPPKPAPQAAAADSDSISDPSFLGADSLRTLRGDSLAAARIDSTRMDSTLVDSFLASLPALSIYLPVRDRAKLESSTRRDLMAADSLARAAALRPLPARERDKLETALGLVKQARQALDRGDISAAANLAYKARLLAAEVSAKL